MGGRSRRNVGLADDGKRPFALDVSFRLYIEIGRRSRRREGARFSPERRLADDGRRLDVAEWLLR